MNPEQLKTIVTERFRADGLLHCLDLKDSIFDQLPRFFEESHLTMELSITDPSLVAAASNLMNQLKSDLTAKHGVELEVVVRAKTFV